MNTDTLDKMKRMRLLGMHRAFTTSLEQPQQRFTADEMVAMLIDSEWDDRHNRAIERNLKGARFRYKASIEQLDYSTERGWTRTCCTASQMVSSLTARRMY